MDNTDLIRTESDYKAALTEIDQKMGDSEPGTPEFERFDRLVDQVVAYEAEHYPMGTPSAEAVAEYEAEKRGKISVDTHADALRAGLLAVGATEDDLLAELRGRRVADRA